MCSIGFIVGGLSALYVLTWIPIAYLTGVLFPSQMLEKYPKFNQVIPLIVDGYVLADFLILAPLMGYCASVTNEKWERWEMAALFALGLVLGYLFQKHVIVPGKYPCTLGGAGETSLIGYLHIPFFGAAVAILLMFCFTSVGPLATLVVAAGLMLLIPADMLVPMHFIKQMSGLIWIPDVFKEEPRMYYMIGAAECGLAVLVSLKLVLQ